MLHDTTDKRYVKLLMYFILSLFAQEKWLNTETVCADDEYLTAKKRLEVSVLPVIVEENDQNVF